MAQWKRAGPITQRSEDRNLALLNFADFFPVMPVRKITSNRFRSYFGSKVYVVALIQCGTEFETISCDVCRSLKNKQLISDDFYFLFYITFGKS